MTFFVTFPVLKFSSPLVSCRMTKHFDEHLLGKCSQLWHQLWFFFFTFRYLPALILALFREGRKGTLRRVGIIFDSDLEHQSQSDDLLQLLQQIEYPSHIGRSFKADMKVVSIAQNLCQTNSYLLNLCVQ